MLAVGPVAVGDGVALGEGEGEGEGDGEAAGDFDGLGEGLAFGVAVAPFEEGCVASGESGSKVTFACGGAALPPHATTKIAQLASAATHSRPGIHLVDRVSCIRAVLAPFLRML